jgi:hypothetical protein
LAGLGCFEENVTIEVAGETIRGVAEEDVDRTNADGKASSVQFIHFPFTDAAIEAFRHPAYAHMAELPETVRAALAQDFD